VSFGIFNPDLTAPGVNIYSPAPKEFRCTGTQDLCNDAGFDSRSGTSFSAPFVSGAAALILEKYPNATVEEIRYRLVGGTENVTGSHFETGSGMLNITRAVSQNFWALINKEEKTSIEVWPGKQTYATINFINNDDSDKSLTFEYEQVKDTEGYKTISSPFSFFNTIATKNKNSSTTLTISLPQDTQPGIYSSVLIIKTNESDKVRIPLALIVPQVGPGTFNGTTDHSENSHGIGDNLLYKIIPLNSTELTISIQWENDLSNDLDADVWVETANYQIDSSTSSPLTLTINSSQTEYWLRILNKVGSKYDFNITISSNSDISVNPSNVFANITKNTNKTFTFTLKNNANQKNLELFAYKLNPENRQLSQSYPNSYSLIS